MKNPSPIRLTPPARLSFLFALCLSAIALSAADAFFAVTSFAGSPAYSSQSSGIGTTGAEVIFPADPVLQIRVVGIIGSSDLSSSTFGFQGGGTPAVITYANTNLAATNIYVSGYTGFATNDLLIIQGLSSNKTLTIYGLNNSTNIMTTSAIGVAQTVGGEIFDLGTTNRIKCGAITNQSYQGEAIYVAPRGRPLRVTLTGTGYSSLDSVTVHYDP
jgi:hypothetical protein